MKIPETKEEWAECVAKAALDEVIYEGKTIREWTRIIGTEDAISRQAVLDMMQMRMSGKELYKAVYDLPPIQPKAKAGKWITQWELKQEKEYYVCSECREEFSNDAETGIGMIEYPYCPNCGAKMKK